MTFSSTPVPSPGVILGLYSPSHPPEVLVYTFLSFPLHIQPFVPPRWYRRWIWQCFGSGFCSLPCSSQYHRGSFLKPLPTLPCEFLEENHSWDCDSLHTHMSAAPGTSHSHPTFRNSLKISSWIFSLAYMDLATSFFASTCLSPYFRVVVCLANSVLSRVQTSLISSLSAFSFVVCVEVIVFSALLISKLE